MKRRSTTSAPPAQCLFPSQVHGGETLDASILATGPDTTGCHALFRALGATEVSTTSAAVRDGDSWHFSISTDGWTAAQGVIFWEIWETFPNDYKSSRCRGNFEFISGIATHGAAYDPRTQAEKVVAVLEKAIAGNADASVKSYQINNRRIERYSTAELLDLLKYWRKRLAAENAARCGTPSDVRFGL